jgi:hypothetical protein
MVKFETLYDWAEYYNSKAITVFPSNVLWTELNYPWKQQLQDIKGFDWEDSQWIRGIAGVAKVTLLRFNFAEKDYDLRFKILTRCMSLLGVYHYPWILEENDTISIIVFCHSKERFYIEGFNSISILWDKTYTLPFETKNKQSDAKFFFNAIPMVTPSRIEGHCLKQVIVSLVNEFGLLLNKE